MKPKRKFRASSLRVSPVLAEDVPRALHYSSAGEHSARSSFGSAASFYGPRRWRKADHVNRTYMQCKSSLHSVPAVCCYISGPSHKVGRISIHGRDVDTRLEVEDR